MIEAASPYREPLNRSLTEEERDLVRWLVEHSFMENAARLLPQVDRLTVVSKCNCGCPTIDFALDGKLAERRGEKYIGDWLADIDGMPVYIQLWVIKDDQIISLEVG